MARTLRRSPVNSQTSPTCLEFSLCGSSIHNCDCICVIVFLSIPEDKADQMHTLPYFLACPEPFDFPLLHDSPRKDVVGNGRVLSRGQMMPPSSCLPAPPHPQFFCVLRDLEKSLVSSQEVGFGHYVRAGTPRRKSTDDCLKEKGRAGEFF